MVLYNLSGLSNVSGLGSFIGASNDATGGLLVGLFLLTIWIVLLLAFIKYDFVRAVTGSSFICFIISTFLVYLDWINILFMLILLFLTAGGGLLLYLKED